MAQIPLDPSARADNPVADAERDDGTHEARSDVAYLRLFMVNVVMVGVPLCGDRNWTLVDAGLPGMAGRIMDAAEARFGVGARPAAILMTHGHFDHSGAVHALAEAWDAPVYCHPDEAPYLSGAAEYPPPDPSVGGGLLASLSAFYPRRPVDVRRRLLPLASDGLVPPLPGWRWIATPGHTPGHVSFWRESDRTLIVGDAFVTTAQESVYAVVTQKPEMHGPPMYFTPDWITSGQSVRTLAAMEPEVVVPGHGRAMQGPLMRDALHRLADQFEEVAVPAKLRRPA